MSLRLMSISSTPCEERIWKPGEALLADLDLHGARVEAARRGAGSRSFSRVDRDGSAAGAAVLRGGVGRGRRASGGKEEVEQLLLDVARRPGCRTSACFSRRTMSTADSVRSRIMESTSRPT